MVCENSFRLSPFDVLSTSHGTHARRENKKSLTSKHPFWFAASSVFISHGWVVHSPEPLVVISVPMLYLQSKQVTMTNVTLRIGILLWMMLTMEKPNQCVKQIGSSTISQIYVKMMQRTGQSISRHASFNSKCADGYWLSEQPAFRQANMWRDPSHGNSALNDGGQTTWFVYCIPNIRVVNECTVHHAADRVNPSHIVHSWLDCACVGRGKQAATWAWSWKR